MNKDTSFSSSDNNKPKVIGVGFQKTGTSSLRDALKLLGYKVGDNNFQLLPSILKGNFKRVLRWFDRFDAVEDNPWPLIYKELDKARPGCKFILTTRDEESWYRSVSKHVGDLRDPMHEWIYGRNKGLPKDDKDNTIRVYSEHNQEVIRYFADRPEDLLILDVSESDKMEKICQFLGIDSPTQTYPHQNNSERNRNDASFKRKLKVRKKRIKYWLQIKFYDLMGWW